MRTHATVFPSTTETMMSKGEEVAMRTRNKAFLSGAIMAAVGLLAAPAVMAADLPRFCTAEGWTITLVGDPVLMSTGCPVSSPCVKTTYEITIDGALRVDQDHVTGLSHRALYAVTGVDITTGSRTYAVGLGEPFGLGAGDTSRSAFKVNPNGNQATYVLWHDTTSTDLGLVPVKVKKGNRIGACPLAGLAEVEAAANPLATFTPDLEEVIGGKCKVHATTNKHTGVTTVHLLTHEEDPASDLNCSLEGPFPIGTVTVQVGGFDVGPVKFSEGFNFVVGPNSCGYKQYYEPGGPVYRVCW